MIPTQSLLHVYRLVLTVPLSCTIPIDRPMVMCASPANARVLLCSNQVRICHTYSMPSEALVRVLYSWSAPKTM